MAKRKRRSRRKFTDEFKQEAVKLVTLNGLTVAEAARNLGIHPNVLRNWKLNFEADQEDPTLTEDERMEMARLRAENRRLRMERDILKKATAFFANEKN